MIPELKFKNLKNIGKQSDTSQAEYTGRINI